MRVQSSSDAATVSRNPNEASLGWSRARSGLKRRRGEHVEPDGGLEAVAEALRARERAKAARRAAENPAEAAPWCGSSKPSMHFLKRLPVVLTFLRRRSRLAPEFVKGPGMASPSR